MLCPKCHEIPKDDLPHELYCDPFQDHMRDYEPWTHYSPIYELMSFYADFKEYRLKKQDLKKKELELFDREERLKILEGLAVENLKRIKLEAENGLISSLRTAEDTRMVKYFEKQEEHFKQLFGLLQAALANK